MYCEGDVPQDRLEVKGNGNVLKNHNGLCRLGSGDPDICAVRRGSSIIEVFGHGLGHLPKMPTIARLTIKSTTMMKTEEMTTAWVVDLPTPWVPPLVFMPK